METLEGILPLCAVCGKIRDGRARWQPLERYVLDHSKDQISHEVCPDCAKRAGQTFDRR